ncbi:type IV toxin-antitoxin system AbiEi family antitoxin domain-containing protein [Arthrobacter alkaliphilus]|uniref:endonuclease domain-containing protein n=1 Tax=Arthrobacter alkaliphilus TaxID=369936 RepID=UPI001F2C0F73|nr:DUF559 domain-containing protein [Arthrobacter alkaliphilus]
MDLVVFLKYAGSAARTSTVKQAGFSDRAIRTALAGGKIVRRRWGVLALPVAHEDIVAALSANGLLTCVSGARHHGIWVLHEPRTLHLLCKHGNAKDFVVHRESLVESRHISPVASLTDTLLHSLRCLPEIESAIMVESALLQGRTNLDYLRERLPGNRNGAARKVLTLVDGSADSPIEVVARILFRQAGIRTETQVELPGIGIVDFLLEGRLIVEVDGESHLQPRQVKKDRRRNNAGTVKGFLVLRYDYSQIVYQREAVLAEVLQVLRRRGR